jgi:hypothetical protein
MYDTMMLPAGYHAPSLRPFMYHIGAYILTWRLPPAGPPQKHNPFGGDNSATDGADYSYVAGDISQGRRCHYGRN